MPRHVDTNAPVMIMNLKCRNVNRIGGGGGGRPVQHKFRVLYIHNSYAYVNVPSYIFTSNPRYRNLQDKKVSRCVFSPVVVQPSSPYKGTSEFHHNSR